MNTGNILNNDILNNNLNSALVPLLGEEDISLAIQESSGAFTETFNQDLSLIEQAIAAQRNSPSPNQDSSVNNFSIPNLDSIIGSNPENFQVNNVDFNDTSFAPPQNELDFQGGFGDYDGGNDVTFEVKNEDGYVVETYTLKGEGQATLYRDSEGEKAYIFFSGTDESTSVKISAKSNISFGNYIGDSLEIETTGSINGESVSLTNPDDTGLILKSGIEGEDEKLEVLGYDAIHLGAGSAQGINNEGDVIVDGYGASRSFIYSDGEINYLGSDNRITPNGINDSGQVVGSFINSDHNSHAFLYSNGTISDLGVLPGAETYEIPSGSDLVEVPYNFASSNAKAINNNGQIVGIASSKFSWGYDLSRLRAFISDGGSMTDLQSQLNGLFGYEEDFVENPDSYWFYSSEAYGINDLGQVVGLYFDDFTKAFVYGGGQNINLHSLLGDNVENSFARDINNEGQIIGAFNTRGSSYTAFIYNDGQIKTLGGSLSLIDINNNGVAVGNTPRATNAILYDTNEQTTVNLNLVTDFEENIVLSSARGINDKGQIAATGYFTSDIERTNNAFLLNPRFAEPKLKDYINIGNISTFGDSVVLQGGEINLTGETVTTNGGSVTFDGKTSVKGNSLTIDSAGGDVSFTNTLDGVSGGSQNLTIKALNGDVRLDKAVGGSAALNDFTVAGAATVTAVEDITVNGNLKLEIIDNLATANLAATGLINLSLGKVGEEVFNSTGNLTTGNINAQALSVLNNGSLTAGNIQTTDGDIEIISLNNLTLGQLTATNGAIDLISGVGGINLTGAATSDNLLIALAKQAIFTKNLTSHNEAVILKSSTRGININGVIAAYDDVSVAALKNVVVKEITSADGGVSLISATAKVIDTGAIAAVEDVTVGAALDITTKNITASLGSVDLVSTQASVTVNGAINSAFDVGISAQNNVTTNTILAYEGAVGIQAIQGAAFIRSNIRTFNQDVYVVAQNTVNVRNVISKGGDVYLVSQDGLLKTGYLRTDKTKNIGGKVYLEAGNTISVDGSVSISGNDYSIYTGVTEAGWVSVATETKVLEGNKTQFEGKDIATAEIYGDLALLTEPREAPTIPNPLPIILEIIRGIIDESRTPNPQNANDINPITGKPYTDEAERELVKQITLKQEQRLKRIINSKDPKFEPHIPSDLLKKGKIDDKGCFHAELVGHLGDSNFGEAPPSVFSNYATVISGSFDDFLVINKDGLAAFYDGLVNANGTATLGSMLGGASMPVGSVVEAKYGYFWLNKFIKPESQLPVGFVRAVGLEYDPNPPYAGEYPYDIYRAYERIKEEINREAEVAQDCGLTFFVSFNRSQAARSGQELFEFYQTKVTNYSAPVVWLTAPGQILP